MSILIERNTDMYWNPPKKKKKERSKLKRNQSTDELAQLGSIFHNELVNKKEKKRTYKRDKNKDIALERL